MRNQKGFTLIEMLVVIAIVGLLSSVVVVGLSGARAKARDARRVADIRQIQNDLEVTYTDASGYPAQTTSGGPPGDPTDPQGTAYLYTSPVGTDAHTYKLGIGLETSENNNFDANVCPATIITPAFCVSP